MGNRSRARELAFQLLVQLDLNDGDGLDRIPEEVDEQTDDPAVRNFAIDLIRGTREHCSEIDAVVARTAVNWSLDRMSSVERNLLRLGTHELLHRPDVPPAVAINEAVELAKRYSTAQSGGFVNGILDRIRIDHPRQG